jgi:branched-chain amino acid transport system ATP-binding protein
MLEITNLEVRYDRVLALHELSLTVRSGEAVGIIGPNGAGKSTTLNTIFGLVRPASGSITFNGTSLVGLNPETVASKGLALVPEGRHIFGTLTVQENLELGAMLRTDRRQASADMEVMLDRFPVLGRYRRTPAGRLSGGEQQQLAIARALLNRPSLLLLDEPSLGLAPMLVDHIFEILDTLRAEGVTILLVEQVAARTIQFTDRTYILRSGRLVTTVTREDLHGQLDLTEAYLGA